MFRAPGVLWLLRHELRLLWRGTGGGRSWLLTGGFVILWALMHAAGWSVMRDFSAATPERPAFAAFGFLAWFALLLVVSAAFGIAVRVLFERGDLDLLLASPISPHRVFAVRALAIAAGSTALVAFLWLPFAHGGAARGEWRLLAAYPLLFAAGLGAAGLSLFATLALVRAFGARRARTLAQVLGAVAGAALFLASQAPNLLPGRVAETFYGLFRGKGGPGEWDALLTLPLRALFGDPGALAIAIVTGGAAFVLAVRWTGRACSDGMLEPEPASRAARATMRAPAFGAGLAQVVVAKELRLIARDPKLISQTLLQVLYLAPIFAIALKRGSLPEVLAPTVILLCANLAGNLAWITVSAEEAPDLVGSAPVAAGRVRWLKVAAALSPVLVLAMPFVAWYAAQSALGAVAFGACLACALWSACIVQVWGGRPAGTRDLKRRQKGNVLLGLVEFASSMGWAGACLGLLAGSPLFVVGVAAGLVAPYLAWRSAPA
jgi:ABC-2 type transport system permease protein